MRTLLHLDRNSWRHLAVLVLIGAIQVMAAIAVMSTIRLLFDNLLDSGQGESTDPVSWANLLMMTAGFGTLAWMRAQERVTAEKLGQGVIANLRVKLFDQFCSLPVASTRKISRGSLLMRFTGDLNALRNWITQGIARLLVAGIFIGISLIWVGLINQRIALAILLLIATGSLLSWHLGGHLRKRVGEARSKRAILTTNIAEKSSALSVIQVFAQHRRERKRIQRQSGALADAMINRARVIGQLRGVSELTVGFVLLILLVMGANEITRGRLETGELVSIIGLLIMLMPSLRSLGRINEYWHAARVSTEKIDYFMRKENQREGSGSINGPLRREGAVIQFESVQLDRRLKALDGKIEAGKKLAITGPNGAGKSTLLQLIVRLTDPSQGRIRIAGKPIEKIALSRLRSQISMVSPDLPLLRGSIRRNLRYRNFSADETELRRVISLCELEPWLESLPDGLATRIAEGGSNLSPGERQRLALARALLGHPAVLLLDEPELNADPSTRALFKRIIKSHQGTLIMVTHDRDFASLADEVWHMENGTLVERGEPHSLLDKRSKISSFFMGRKSA